MKATKVAVASVFPQTNKYNNDLYQLTLTSVSIFFILFNIIFLRYWQGEFVEQSQASLVGNISIILVTLMSADLGVIFCGGSRMPKVTLRYQSFQKI